jgi:hypothetical protein
MGKSKPLNVSELINDYDENFIDSISLKNVSNGKDLKELLVKLEKANYVVTTFYETMYNDYITMINSDCPIQPHGLDIETIKKYKMLASKVQKVYSYILYMNTFDNPFKVKRK